MSEVEVREDETGEVSEREMDPKLLLVEEVVNDPKALDPADEPEQTTEADLDDDDDEEAVV